MHAELLGLALGRKHLLYCMGLFPPCGHVGQVACVVHLRPPPTLHSPAATTLTIINPADQWQEIWDEVQG